MFLVIIAFMQNIINQHSLVLENLTFPYFSHMNAWGSTFAIFREKNQRSALDHQWNKFQRFKFYQAFYKVKGSRLLVPEEKIFTVFYQIFDWICSNRLKFPNCIKHEKKNNRRIKGQKAVISPIFNLIIHNKVSAIPVQSFKFQVWMVPKTTVYTIRQCPKNGGKKKMNK